MPEHYHIWRRVVNTLFCADPTCNAKSRLILQDGKLVRCYNCRGTFLFDASYFQNKTGNLQCPECGDGIPTLTLERQQKILNETLGNQLFTAVERKSKKEIGKAGEKLSEELDVKLREIEKQQVSLSKRELLLEQKSTIFQAKRDNHAIYLREKRNNLRSMRAAFQREKAQLLQQLTDQRRAMKANYDKMVSDFRSQNLRDLAETKEVLKAELEAKYAKKAASKTVEQVSPISTEDFMTILTEQLNKQGGEGNET